MLVRAGEILGQLEQERHLFEIEGRAPEEEIAGDEEARQVPEETEPEPPAPAKESEQLSLFE